MAFFLWYNLPAGLYSLSSPLMMDPQMMKQLAGNRYTNHKAGRLIDGTSDRLVWLLWGALSQIYDTFYLVINATPTLPPCNPQIHSPPPPTSCLWPIIIALPLLAMCWESKGSHLSLIRMEPHHLLLCVLNHNQSLGRQRWIGTFTTLYLSESPSPSALQRAAVTDK